jgi:predicted MPP superfamily phosphohydrolase
MPLILICLIILAFSAWYTPFRLKKLLGLKKVWPWQLTFLGLIAGFIVVIGSGLYTSTNPLFAHLYNFLGLFFIFQVYLFFYLLLAQLAGLFFKKLPKKRLAVLGLILCFCLVAGGLLAAQSFRVTDHEIAVDGLSGPVTIMHIPDLHLGAQRQKAYLEKILEVIKERKPDLVLYNGDLADSNIALTEEIFSLFKTVDSEQYFTTGNHEFYIDTDRVLSLVAGAGIRILRSEMVETHGLQLIGLEYMNGDRQTHNSHMVNDLTIEEELPKILRSREKPTLLVHHSPAGLQYVSQGDIDVMLSGHTHGGQLFPGTMLIKFNFPRYKGRHQVDGTTLLVSQGAGTFGPWMRLGTFNEVQFITLKPK